MSNENMKLELDRLKKQLEKNLISTCVAPPSVKTAETKKEIVKSMGQARTDRLKSTGTTYISNFQSSAKGT